jgi:hypothetical protein
VLVAALLLGWVDAFGQETARLVPHLAGLPKADLRIGSE